MCRMTSKRKGHAIESNARTISILSNMHGFLCACSSLAESWTILKLSWMTLPLTNALWFTRTSKPQRQSVRQHFGDKLAYNMNEGDGAKVLNCDSFGRLRQEH
jgi:hypothetical protein